MSEISPNASVKAVEQVLDALKNPEPSKEPADKREIPEFADVTLDTAGHFGHTGVVPFQKLSYWQARELHSIMRWEEIEGENSKLPKMTDLLNLECHVCGGRFHVNRAAPRQYAISVPCSFPGGMPVYDVVLAIPSGRIVFANDLRTLAPVNANFGGSSAADTRGYTEALATGGLALLFTGNTCPNVWKVNSTELRVANYHDSAEYAEGGEFDGDDVRGTFTPKDQWGEDQGSICTDLWWYSAMDYDLFVERCVGLGWDPEKVADFIVDVEPGNYAFSQEKPDRDTVTELFSIIRKTERDAMPIKLRDTAVSSSLSGSQAWDEIVRMRRDWPTITPNGFAALAHFLPTNGTGYDWKGGLVTNGSGVEDEPFRKLEFSNDPTPTDHPLAGLIPFWEGFHVGKRPAIRRRIAKHTGNSDAEFSEVYPIAHGYNRMGTAPLQADPWWLAACLIFTKSVLVNPHLMQPEYNQPKVFGQTLHYLLEIVEARGGIEWIAPYMKRWIEAGPTLLGEDA